MDKAMIVISILRALHRLGAAARRIVLAAPSGKAAHRIAKVIKAS
jgi:hypothetical protein